MTWLALWLFDEGSGTTVADSESSPVNLTVSGATWATNAAGAGLSFVNDSGDQAANTAISGTKLEFGSGITQFTVEITATFDFFGGTRGLFRMLGTGALHIQRRGTLDGNLRGVAFAITSAPSDDVQHTVHFVFDTANGTAANRFRAYVDGTLVATTNSLNGETLQSVTQVLMGFTGDGSFPGQIWQAAFADHVVDATEAASRAAALASDNDADPAAEPPAPVAAVTTLYSEFERRRVLL